MQRTNDSGGKSTRAAGRDATLATAVLMASIYLGSDGLAHFDTALTGYCIATVVACFALTYQVAVFWRRPPAATGCWPTPRRRRPRFPRRAHRGSSTSSW